MADAGISGRDSPCVNAAHPQTPSALISGVPARPSPDDQHSPPSQSLRRRLESTLIVEHPPQHLGLRRHRLTHRAHRNHLPAKNRPKGIVFATSTELIGSSGETPRSCHGAGQRDETGSRSWRRVWPEPHEASVRCRRGRNCLRLACTTIVRPSTQAGAAAVHRQDAGADTLNHTPRTRCRQADPTARQDFSFHEQGHCREQPLRPSTLPLPPVSGHTRSAGTSHETRLLPRRNLAAAPRRTPLARA